MDIRLALMCGTDIPIPECQIVLHQPTLKEISYIGETDFFTGIQCLCLNKTMFVKDESLLEQTNNFQIFMTIMSEPAAAEKKKSVQQVLTLLFPKYKVITTPRTLIFMTENSQNIIVDESNFEFFQDNIRIITCQNSGHMDQQAFNPGNKKAQEIAEKLMRGRQRVAAQKNEGNISVFSQYISVLTVGINSMSIYDVSGLTMYQLYDLIERYVLQLNWDMDVRCRLAGGKPESQPDNWMKNIH